MSRLQVFIDTVFSRLYFWVGIFLPFLFLNSNAYGQSSCTYTNISPNVTYSLVWSQTYGGTGNEDAQEIIETSDGNYLFAGFSSSPGGNGGDDIYVVKIHKTGQEIWAKKMGYTGDERAFSVIETSEGNYLIAGYTSSRGAGGNDPYLIKLNPTGSVIWTGTYGGNTDERAWSVIETSDNHYVIAGRKVTSGKNTYDLFAVKIASDSTQVWDKSKMKNDSHDELRSVIEDDAGNLVFAGSFANQGANSFDALAWKLEPSGAELWDKNLGGNQWDYFLDIAQSSDNNYLMAGTGRDIINLGFAAFRLVKTDKQGVIIWDKHYGLNTNIAPTDYKSLEIVESKNSNTFLFGGAERFSTANAQLEFLFTESDKDGTLLRSQSFGGPDIDQGNFMIETSDSTLLMAGSTESFGAGGTDAWVIIVKREPFIDIVSNINNSLVKNIPVCNTSSISVLLGTTSPLKSFSEYWTPSASKTILSTPHTVCYDNVYYYYKFFVDTTRLGYGSNTLSLTINFEDGTSSVFTQSISRVGRDLSISKTITTSGNQVKIEMEDRSKYYGDTSHKVNQWTANSKFLNTTNAVSILTDSTISVKVIFQTTLSPLCPLESVTRIYRPKKHFYQPCTYSNLNTQVTYSVVWSQTYGGTGNEDAQEIIETSDGNYLFVGFSSSTGGNGGDDIYITKINKIGQEIWAKKMGYTGNERAFSIIETSEGNYLIAGYTSSRGAGAGDSYLIKLTPTGSLVWTGTYGVITTDEAHSVIETSDKNYVIVGNRNSYIKNATEIFAATIANDGKKIWSIDNRSLSFGHDLLRSVIEDDEGNLVFVGWYYNLLAAPHQFDAVAIKVTPTGSQIWQKNYGTGGDDVFFDIEESTDGNYLMAGIGSNNPLNFDAYRLAKVDKQGSIIWDKYYGPGVDIDPDLTLKLDIVKSKNSNIFLFGGAKRFSVANAQLNFFFTESDKDGTFLRLQSFGGANTEMGYSMIETSDSTLLMAGSTESFGAGGTDAWILEVKRDPFVEIISNIDNSKINNIPICNNSSVSILLGTTSPIKSFSEHWTPVTTQSILSRPQTVCYDGIYYYYKFFMDTKRLSYGNNILSLTVSFEDNTSFTFIKDIHVTGQNLSINGNSDFVAPQSHILMTDTSSYFGDQSYRINSWTVNSVFVENKAQANLLTSVKSNFDITYQSSLSPLCEIESTTLSLASITTCPKGIPKLNTLKTCTHSNLQQKNPFLSIIWTKTLVDTTLSYENNAVANTDDDAYMVAVTVAGNTAGKDIWFFKYDNDGKSLWSRKINGTNGDEVSDIIKTRDGGGLLLATTKNKGAGKEDALLIKTDSDGTELWNHTYGGTNDDTARVVIETSDNHYLIAGTTRSMTGGNNIEMWLVKLNSDGSLVWQKNYGQGTGADNALSVLETSDGSYLLVGGSYDVTDQKYLDFTIKTDSNGNILWQKAYKGGQNMQLYSVIETSDGNYVMVGDYLTTGIDYDVFLIKVNINGQELWRKLYHSEINDVELGRAVFETHNNSLLIAGISQYFNQHINGPSAYDGDDYMFIKTDSKGNKLWETTYDGRINNFIILPLNFIPSIDIEKTNEESFIVVGENHDVVTGRAQSNIMKINGSELDFYSHDKNKIVGDVPICATSSTSIIFGTAQPMHSINYKWEGQTNINKLVCVTPSCKKRNLFFYQIPVNNSVLTYTINTLTLNATNFRNYKKTHNIMLNLTGQNLSATVSSDFAYPTAQILLTDTSNYQGNQRYRTNSWTVDSKYIGNKPNMAYKTNTDFKFDTRYESLLSPLCKVESVVINTDAKLPCQNLLSTFTFEMSNCPSYIFTATDSSKGHIGQYTSRWFIDSKLFTTNKIVLVNTIINTGIHTLSFQVIDSNQCSNINTVTFNVQGFPFPTQFKPEIYMRDALQSDITPKNLICEGDTIDLVFYIKSVTQNPLLESSLAPLQNSPKKVTTKKIKDDWYEYAVALDTTNLTAGLNTWTLNVKYQCMDGGYTKSYAFNYNKLKLDLSVNTSTCDKLYKFTTLATATKNLNYAWQLDGKNVTNNTAYNISTITYGNHLITLYVKDIDNCSSGVTYTFNFPDYNQKLSITNNTLGLPKKDIFYCQNHAFSFVLTTTHNIKTMVWGLNPHIIGYSQKQIINNGQTPLLKINEDLDSLKFLNSNILSLSINYRCDLPPVSIQHTFTSYLIKPSIHIRQINCSSTLAELEDTYVSQHTIISRVWTTSIGQFAGNKIIIKRGIAQRDFSVIYTITDIYGCSASVYSKVILENINQVKVLTTSNDLSNPCVKHPVKFIANPPCILDKNIPPTYQWFLNGKPTRGNNPEINIDPNELKANVINSVQLLLTANETLTASISFYVADIINPSFEVLSVQKSLCSSDILNFVSTSIASGTNILKEVWEPDHLRPNLEKTIFKANSSVSVFFPFLANGLSTNQHTATLTVYSQLCSASINQSFRVYSTPEFLFSNAKPYLCHNIDESTDFLPNIVTAKSAGIWKLIIEGKSYFPKNKITPNNFSVGNYEIHINYTNKYCTTSKTISLEIKQEPIFRIPNKVFFKQLEANIEVDIIYPDTSDITNFAWSSNIVGKQRGTLNPYSKFVDNEIFSLEVWDKFGCYSHTQATYKVFNSILANTITPNNDGFNDNIDYSEVLNYFPNAKMYLYDANGRKVYETNNLIWDGSIGGVKLWRHIFFALLELNNDVKNRLVIPITVIGPIR